jgi:hypothetical protein
LTISYVALILTLAMMLKALPSQRHITTNAT